MSWDVFAMKLPESIRSVDEIPDDFLPPPIGRRADLIARILEVAPFADFSDPTWGQLDAPGFSIEVALGDDEVVHGIAFFVRGGDTAAGCLVAILDHLGLRAIETGFGEILDPTTAVDSLRRWRAYRDQVVGG